MSNKGIRLSDLLLIWFWCIVIVLLFPLILFLLICS